jgi:hypothetical protein
MSGAQTHQTLKSKGLSFLGDVSLFDSEGVLINWSGSLPAPALNISEREYFRTFKSGARSEPVLAEAVRSLRSNVLSTVIAHRMAAPDGAFLGVMTRRIDPANYEKFFASVSPGMGAAVSMFHRDGTLLARYPRVEHMIGQRFTSGPLLQAVLNKGGQQTLRIVSPVDQMERLGSAAPLHHFPAIVVATNTVTAALTDWREQTRFLVTAATLAASVVALILFLIIRQMTRQSREAQQRL